MNINRNYKIVIGIIGLVLFCVGFFFAYKFLKSYYSRDLLKNIKQIVLTPDPLSGPIRNSSTDYLNSDKIIESTNYKRNEHGLKSLQKDDKLTVAAENKVDDMFKNQYFEHVSPYDGNDVSYWVGDVKYSYITVGENLALGDFNSEAELVQAWMDSPGHRENILNKSYTQIGAAAKKNNINGRNTWLAVQIFASPSSNCQLPNTSLKNEIEKKQIEYEKIDMLNAQVESLRNEGNKLIQEGNDKIKQGNKIFKETKNSSLAQPYWDEGENLYNLGKEKIEQSNQIITEINKLSDLYSEIKILIDKYNKEVEKYNKCVGI